MPAGGTGRAPTTREAARARQRTRRAARQIARPPAGHTPPSHAARPTVVRKPGYNVPVRNAVTRRQAASVRRQNRRTTTVRRQARLGRAGLPTRAGAQRRLVRALVRQPEFQLTRSDLARASLPSGASVRKRQREALSQASLPTAADVNRLARARRRFPSATELGSLPAPALSSPSQLARRRQIQRLHPDKSISGFAQDLAIAFATAPIGGPETGVGRALARLGIRGAAKLLGRGGARAVERAAERAAATRGGAAAGRVGRALERRRVDRLARRGPLSRGVRSHAPAPVVATGSADPQARRLPQIPIQTTRALATSGKARERTVTGLAQLLPAILAAPVQLGANAVREGPVPAIKEFGKGAGADYSRRYGALLRGDPGAAKAFRKRLEREGAGAEILDLTGAAALGGATLGRALGRGARAGTLGRRLERLATEPRPRIRTSGGAAGVRGQELAPNLFRALGQRTEDRLRTRNLNRRNMKARAGGRGVPGLQPQAANEVVRATQALQGRGMRMAASEVSAQAFQGLRQRMQHFERAARANIARLDKRQRRAFVAGLEGMPLDPGEARQWALRRKASIRSERIGQLAAARTRLDRAERKLANARTPGGIARAQAAVKTARAQEEKLRSVPAVNRSRSEELRVVNEIIDHPHEILTDKFREVVRQEQERSRAADALNVSVHPATAEARRLRVQGETMGVLHPHEVATNRIKAAARKAQAQTRDPAERARIRAARDEDLARLDEQKPQLDQAYAAAVREARPASAGEPGYVAHRARRGRQYADRAPGGGLTAVAPQRQSKMALLRRGERDVTPEAYADTLARQVKYGVNWRMVDRQYEHHALSNINEREIRAATGKTSTADQLSIEDLRKVLERRGYDVHDWAFVNPRMLAKRESELSAPANATDQAISERAAAEPAHATDPPPDVRSGFEASAFDADKLAALGGDRRAFEKTRGWYAMPKAAFDELDSATRPSGKAGRMFSKAMGFQSRIILGTSPSWLPFQIGANAFVAGFGLHGNVFDVAASRRWWKSLTPHQQHAVSEVLGAGALRGHGEKMYLGAAGGRLAQAWHALAETPFVQRAARYNPLDLVFRADDAQNSFFRRAVLYSQVKRTAYQRMGELVPELARGNDRIVRLMELPPQERVTRILEHPEMLEHYGQKVDDFLGNWHRYTASERRILKRGILFYGFFRYSMRMLFYTMPVKHPIMASIIAKLGQLHAEEVKDLVGGDTAPWAFSRLFFGGERDYDPNTASKNLRSIDVLRANPVTNPITSALGEAGPKALAGVMSPLLAAAFDQLSDKTHFTGLGYRVKGSTATVGSPGSAPLPLLSGTRGRILLDDLLSLHSGYRLGKQLTQTGTQGDDSLLFSPRPIRYKQSAAIAREAERKRAAGSTWDRFLQWIAPEFIPKRDVTAQQVANRKRKRGQSVGGSSPAGPGDLRNLDLGKGGVGLTPQDLQGLDLRP